MEEELKNKENDFENQVSPIKFKYPQDNLDSLTSITKIHAGSSDSERAQQFFAKRILQFFQTPIFSNFQSRHNYLTEELDEIKMNLFTVKEESKKQHKNILVEFITKNPNQTRNSMTDANINTNFKTGTNNLKQDNFIKPKLSIKKSQNATSFYNTINSKKLIDLKSPRRKPEPKLESDKKDKKEAKVKKEKRLIMSSQKIIMNEHFQTAENTAGKNKVEGGSINPETHMKLKRNLSGEFRNEVPEKFLTLEDTKPIKRANSKKPNFKAHSFYNFNLVDEKHFPNDVSEVKKDSHKFEKMWKYNKGIKANEDDTKHKEKVKEKIRNKEDNKKSNKNFKIRKVITKKNVRGVHQSENILDKPEIDNEGEEDINHDINYWRNEELNANLETYPDVESHEIVESNLNEIVGNLDIQNFRLVHTQSHSYLKLASSDPKLKANQASVTNISDAQEAKITSDTQTVNEVVQDNDKIKEAEDIVKNHIPVEEAEDNLIEQILDPEALDNLIEEILIPEDENNVHEHIHVKEDENNVQERIPLKEAEDNVQEDIPIPEDEDNLIEQMLAPEDENNVRENIPVPEDKNNLRENIPVPEDKNNLKEQIPVTEAENNNTGAEMRIEGNSQTL